MRLSIPVSLLLSGFVSYQAAAMPAAVADQVEEIVAMAQEDEQLDNTRVEIFNANGDKISVVSHNIKENRTTVSSWEYDSQNRLIKKNIVGNITEYEYSPTHKRETSENHSAYWYFDDQGREIYWRSLYTGRDPIFSTTVYNDEIREKKTTYSYGSVLTKRFDERGNEIFYLFSDGRGEDIPTLKTYREDNQVETIRRGSNFTLYAYTAAGNVSMITKNGEVQTVNQYDPKDRIIFSSNPTWYTFYTYNDIDKSRTGYSQWGEGGSSEILEKYDDKGRVIYRRDDYRYPDGQYSTDVTYIFID